MRNNTIFLPGWGYRAEIWQNIAVEYPDAKMLNFPDIIADSLIDHVVEQLLLDIPSGANLVAWSLGGLLAVYFCARFPKHCRRLILVASTPYFLENDDWCGISLMSKNQFLQKFVSQPDKLLQEFHCQVQFPQRDKLIHQHLLQCQKKYHLKYLEFLLENDAREEYKKLSLPIDVIMGTKDVIVSPENNDALCHLNQNTNIKFIEGAGHVPFLTHKNQFMAHLKSSISYDA